MTKKLIKNEQDIAKMREAGKFAAQTLEMIKPYVKEGITTNELNEICHKYITENLASTPAPLGYTRFDGDIPFPKSICTSINHQVCHGIPGDKKLKNGDILNIDVTVKTKDGYHGDTSNMFVIGEPSIRAKKLIKITQECLYLGIQQVKPGATLGDIGHAIQSHAEKSRFSVVRDYCGHGIGQVFHEPPQVMHYGKKGVGPKLQPGMIFTIEPMINVGKFKTKTLPDTWTVITQDRSLSAQFEHTILVTDSGYEVLTLRSEEKGNI